MDQKLKPEPVGTRKLTAILCADVHGYSRLMGTDEESTLQRLTACREIIFGLVRQHRGRVANTAGDAVLAEFASAKDAVAGAVAIQKDIAHLNAPVKLDRQMWFRIGIHLGDVYEREGDLFGDGVNIAARIQSLAEPGGILLSASVFEQIENKSDFVVELVGEHKVKNIDRPIRVHRVVAGQPAAEPDRKPTGTETPDEGGTAVTVGVLPFDNFSGEAEHVHFCDGLAEDLTTALAAVPGIRIVARNTMFAYKGTSPDVRRVGRETAATHVVEGSAQRSGSRVRVNAQLVDTTTGSHLWASRYDREISDLFEVQDDLVRNIVTELGLKVAPGREAAAPSGDAQRPTRRPGDTFVGRLDEMAGLRGAIEDAIAGTARIVMLAGEPGAGKTRTAEELSRFAESVGVRVLWGRVHEEPGAPPYWPWVQVIRTQAARLSAETLRAQMGEAAGVLARFVPELRSRVSGLPEPPALGDREAERFRLFDSFTTFLKLAATNAPLLLVLDNLHWADESSLALLGFVSHEIAASRLVILGTYRDTETTRSHPLSRTLGDLTRERLFERIHLRALDESAVARLIAVAAGEPPPEGLARAVHEHTDGNALFVTEVIRLLAQEGKLAPAELAHHSEWSPQLPEGVREVIGRRLDRLSEKCSELLRVAAVLGREFDSSLAGQLAAELSGPEVSASLEQAASSRLLEEVRGAPGRYRFSHKLVQETLLSELSATRRARLHAAVVDALEARHGVAAEAHAAELAGHCAEARLVMGTAKLVRYSVAAANEATAAGAWEDGYATLRRAIEAKGNEVVDEELAQLYDAVPVMAYVSGWVPEASRVLHATFVRYERLHDAQGLLDTVDTLYKAAEGARAGEEVPLQEYARRALAAIGDTPPAGFRGHLAFAITRYRAAAAPAAIEEALERALRQAKRSSDAAQLSRVHYWWGIALCNQRPGAAADHFRRSIEAAPADWSVSLRINTHHFAGVHYLVVGNTAEAAAHLGASIRLTQGLRSAAHRATAENDRVFLAVNIGDWKTAREASDRSFAASGPSARAVDLDPWLLAHRAMVEHYIGDAAAGDACLERLVEAFRDPASANAVAFALSGIAPIPIVALLCGKRRWLDVAEAAVQQRIAGSLSTRREHLRCLGLIAAARGDPVECRAIDAELAALHGELQGWHARLRGILARTYGDFPAAAGHFEKAHEFLSTAGFRPELGLTCFDLAGAILACGAAGHAARARRLLDQGLALAMELPMGPLEQKIRDRLAGLAPAPARRYPDGITEREVEVLSLVARGMTNKAIAFELSISINTVATHLKHVLEKTGCANRAEAAAYTLRHGLAPADPADDAAYRRSGGSSG